MGADCSGVTGAILANVAMANGMVMISPSATSQVYQLLKTMVYSLELHLQTLVKVK